MSDANDALSNMINTILDEYSRARQKGTLDVAAAIKMLTRQIEPIQKLKNYRLLGRIHTHIGIIEATRGNFDQAIEFFLKAAEAHRADQDITRFAISYANIAETYRLLNDVPSASEYFQLAEEAMEPLEIKEKWSFIVHKYCNEGQLWLTTGNYEEAERLLNHALDLISEYKDEDWDTRIVFSTLPETHSSLARLYALMGKVDEAITHLDEAFRVLRQHENVQLLGHAHQSQAILARATHKDLATITDSLDDSLAHYKKADSKIEIAEALLLYGTVLAEAGDVDGAALKWREASEILEELKLTKRAQKALDQIGKLQS